ncbi:uncharacterized protein P884DRAFT_201631 [Thermothelomyces heterothallicus CBS 202.75]|uniref:uncharacterized protein n=1 Tax=Thermothelomyces heterothallicus CBS 202.75 TaxID=1149848 RepID=UPI003743BAB0
MAQPLTAPAVEPFAPLTHSGVQMPQSFWRGWLRGWDKDTGADGVLGPAHNGHGLEQPGDPEAGPVRRVPRKVVPGLPRTQTFKRQRSEVRSRLEPVHPTHAERRAVSVDRRVNGFGCPLDHSDPRASAPDFLHHRPRNPPSPSPPTSPPDRFLGYPGDLDSFDPEGDPADGELVHDPDTFSRMDVQSMTTSQYDALIERELERKWILNLSMHFRDKSKREKFFVTFRQHEHLWRRVTVSVDYRNAPENSLEADLARTQYQRDKSAKIYEAIRESLHEIDFYDTVTNLKLETRDGRLHVHVVEDVNEIISYPPVRAVQHLNCRRVRERELHFDSHLSGFVYRVRVHGRLLIKKEIPGPDTVDEFLYEINALNQLYHAKNVIRFYGIVVDDGEQHVTGLLISYAPRGALIDVIYDNDHALPWSRREKWARQIVGGLSEIHEAGFVQGDFTLSNIVIDENDDAKIIDINRRGCPIGWEPPEATPLIESEQRISMYIGVKSDLYQLGMVLWALATQEDEPDAFGRPLIIGSDVEVPAWYRGIVDTCLSADPRDRVQAAQLLSWFPESEEGNQRGPPNGASRSLNGDAVYPYDYVSPRGLPRIKTVHPPSDWTHKGWANHLPADDGFSYPSRGRSPPSPMPSNRGDYYDPARYGHPTYAWSDGYNHVVPAVPSVTDMRANESKGKSTWGRCQDSEPNLETYAGGRHTVSGSATETSRDDESLGTRGRSLLVKERYEGKTGPADHDERSLVSTSAWEPPRSRRPGKGTDDMGNGDRIQSKGNTGPESQADSGKDVVERASTPREQRGGRRAESSERSRSSSSRGRNGRSTMELESRGGGQRGTAPLTVTKQTAGSRSSSTYSGNHREEPGADREGRMHRGARAHVPDTSSRPASPALPRPTRSGYDRADDDLKGIGSAHGPAMQGPYGFDHDSETRHHEIIIDEDLTSELDKGLRETSPKGDRRR